MNSITKWLTDPDAANYPFPYQIGDRLKSPAKNIQGIIKNAKYAALSMSAPSPTGSPAASKPTTEVDPTDWTA
jgi:hypothetical protein